MSFRNPAGSWRDILNAIVMIERFTEGMTFEAFREDPKTIAVVERKLLLISEAAIRSGDEAPILCPDQPWHKIRATGNWVRHQHDRIDLESVWGTIQYDLPSLKASVQPGIRSARRRAVEDIGGLKLAWSEEFWRSRLETKRLCLLTICLPSKRS